MRISAKGDYALRAMVELAANTDAPMTAEVIAERQDIPVSFLVKILAELRGFGLVRSQRGSDGGHTLARDPGEISLGDVLRAIGGPLADVHGTAPEDVEVRGSAASMRTVWIALRASVNSVLDTVTILDVARGGLPEHVVALAQGGEGARREAATVGGSS